jgi:hypothetical protein
MYGANEWEADLPSMGVAGKDQPCGRALCQLLERLGSMCQYQRECGVGDSFEARIQIGMPKVRVVSTDKPYAVAASTQDHILIHKNSNARLRLEALVPCRNALPGRKSAMVPVSRHDNYGRAGGGTQLSQEREALRRLVCAIDQVARDDDKRGMFSPDGVDCHAVSPRNAVEVQVRQLYDLHAVETRRQRRRRDPQPSDIQLKRLTQEALKRCGTREGANNNRSCPKYSLSSHGLSSSREDIPTHCLPSPQYMKL